MTQKRPSIYDKQTVPQRTAAPPPVAERQLTAKELEIIRVQNLMKDRVQYSVPFVVKINGRSYPKRGIVTRDVAEVIISASANKQMRLLREKVRTEHEVFQLSSGAISSRVVKTEMPQPISGGVV